MQVKEERNSGFKTTVLKLQYPFETKLQYDKFSLRD